MHHSNPGRWRIADLIRLAPRGPQSAFSGLDDRRAEVRITAADLILNVYLDTHSAQVPPDVVKKLRQMAQSDPDDAVRRMVQRYLREPWAQESHTGIFPSLT